MNAQLMYEPIVLKHLKHLGSLESTQEARVARGVAESNS